MEKTRGFVTIATGKEHYYKIAVNLLNSYRYFCKNPLPFAIIAEEENEYTKQFDKTIILENPKRSYLDKIELANNIPYDETIFIESDFLAYRDINCLFDFFNNALMNDFAVFGKIENLNYRNGFFRKEGIGDLLKKINYIPDFHSGIIFLRKGHFCIEFYDLCKKLEKQHHLYELCEFTTKGPVYKKGAIVLDDNIFALAMSMMNCMPIKRDDNVYCIPLFDEYSKLNISKSELSYKGQGHQNDKDTLLCHFGSALTFAPIYQREETMLNLMISGHKIRARLYPIWFSLKVKYYKFRTRGKNKKKS